MLKFVQFKKFKDGVLRARINTDDDKWDEPDIQATRGTHALGSLALAAQLQQPVGSQS